jgi:hypothetical protein
MVCYYNPKQLFHLIVHHLSESNNIVIPEHIEYTAADIKTLDFLSIITSKNKTNLSPSFDYVIQSMAHTIPFPPIH